MGLDFERWTYEPSGDVDGDPAYDGKMGIDHFVMDGDEQIACAPDERRARLIAAAPLMYHMIKGVLDNVREGRGQLVVMDYLALKPTIARVEGRKES